MFALRLRGEHTDSGRDTELHHMRPGSAKNPATTDRIVSDKTFQIATPDANKFFHFWKSAEKQRAECAGRRRERK